MSRLTVDRNTLAVSNGSDLIDEGVRFWDYVSESYGTAPSAAGPNPRRPTDLFLAQTANFNRFCSGTLTDPGQLFNPYTGRGTREPIYLANEEAGDEGRLFGVTLDGQAQQLPRLGLFSWEKHEAGRQHRRRHHRRARQRGHRRRAAVGLRRDEEEEEEEEEEEGLRLRPRRADQTGSTTSSTRSTPA